MTPDAVGLDVEVATVGSRGAAYLVDLLAFLVVLFALTIAQAVLGGAGFVPGWFAIALLLLLAFVWQFGYPIGFETLWRGRTPGKALLGLRVVTVEGAPIGVRHASIRAIVGLFELLGTFGAPAILTSLISSRSQRLGDLAAGTMVVRERRAAGTPVAEVFAAPNGLEAYVRQLDVSAIGPSEYATVRETLRRAQDLPPDIAHRVTGDLAGRLVGVVRPAPPPGCGPWAFLSCVAAAVQAKRAPAPVATAPAPATAGWGPPTAARQQQGVPAAPSAPATPVHGSIGGLDRVDGQADPEGSRGSGAPPTDRGFHPPA